jgi:predicted acylesterase/phospholipase RssA
MTEREVNDPPTENAEHAETLVERPPLAIAFGGGGLFGIAYAMGVAEALMDGGVDMAGAPAIGTSAGAWAAALIARSIRWAELIVAIGPDIPRVPDPRRGRLRDVAARVFGEDRCPGMSAVACELPRLRRVVLPGADYPVADIIAASSAVPALFAPHTIDGRRLVDGGVRSLASVDLAAPADHLLIIAPLTGPMLGPFGALAQRALGGEIQGWKRRNSGAEHWLISPNRAIARLARSPHQLFDANRARACYPVAYEQGMALRQRWFDS